jgi:ribonuclease Z
MKFEVLILGSSSATPMYGRHPTAQLINFNEQFHLVDCGEGTQMQLSRYGIKINRIRTVFISHLHGDHYFGLPGLISSMHLMGRNEPLQLFGPPGLEEILKLQFQFSQTVLRFPLEIRVISPDGGEQWDLEQWTVQTFALDHRIPCTGFRFQEKIRKPSIDISKATLLGVPVPYYPLLKKGIDYVDTHGVTTPWQALTLPPPIPRSYAYCSDTKASGGYLHAIQNVDLLYHEATFTEEFAGRAAETFHSTAKQAAAVAVTCGAKQLIIGHFSARYKELFPLKEEAQSIFPSTQLANEGQWYAIPLQQTSHF